jgi:hypothetical protein
LALFGKPLLKTFKVVHDYESDIVRIPKKDNWIELKNQYYCGKKEQSHHLTKNHHVFPSSKAAPTLITGQHLDTKMCTNLKGDHCAPPSRQVFQHINNISEPVDETIIEQAKHETQEPFTLTGNKRCAQEKCPKKSQAK